MTDEEMAIAVGDKLLDVQHENAVLRGILRSMKQPDGSPVPWEAMKDQGLPELRSSPTSQYKYEELRLAIHAQYDHSSALTKLHNFVLGQIP